MKADEATIAAARRGTWCAEHLFALAQALERYDLLTGQIERAEARIDALVETLASTVDASTEDLLAKPARTQRERRRQLALRAMLGVDLTAIPTIGVETALTITSEVGPDLSRFPSVKHFCSWLALAPGTGISGGKQLRGPQPKRVNRAGQALRMAASTARNSDSYIGACHRARLRRLDRGRANKATAHQLARLAHAMLTRGEEYVAREVAHFEAERHDRQSEKPPAPGQALQLGARGHPSRRMTPFNQQVTSCSIQALRGRCGPRLRAAAERVVRVKARSDSTRRALRLLRRRKGDRPRRRIRGNPGYRDWP